MTQLPPTEAPRCKWCSRPFERRRGPGRPREFCKTSHRQRAYEARRLGQMLEPDQILMKRETLQRISDVLYRIEAALQDVDLDLADGAEPARYRSALWHLYEAASDARTVSLEPIAIGQIINAK